MIAEIAVRTTAHFPPDAIVSSDRLRAVVGSGEDDIAASTDAFALLEEIVSRRVARGLTTVIDSTSSGASFSSVRISSTAALTGRV